jgi:valyl-tRNA synthetase
LFSITKDKWFEWLGNIREWCISRQLWWGHRIPAYFVHILKEGVKKEKIDTIDENYWVVANTEEEALKIAMKRFNLDSESDLKLEQDPDVLDTWFSSGIFPFSTMGWPNSTKDMNDFYPNSVLETGSDIIFFWVARMVFMGYALTDKLPFHSIFLHAMVRDKNGKKMSN